MARGASWRIIAVTLSLALAVLVLRTGIARSPLNRSAVAERYAVHDARLSGRLAMSQLEELVAAKGDTAVQRRQIEGHARAALQRDLTVVDAVGALGFMAELAGQRPRALMLMRVSDSLSRRHLPTRLWLIEEAVARDDVEGALRHFDIALRTSASAASTLFPVLNSALADKRLIAPIARTLDQQPEWAGPFLYTAINSGIELPNVSLVYSRLRHKPTHAGEGLTKLLIDTLVARREFAAVLSLSNSMTPSLRAAGPMVDPNFTSPAGSPPRNWALVSSVELSANRIQDDNGRPALNVTHSGGGGIAAYQLLSLKPGTYRFSASAMSGAPAGSVSWALVCADDETRAVGSLALAAVPSAAVWRVPDSCPYQWLRLILKVSDEIASQNLVVGPIGLTRVANR